MDATGRGCMKVTQGEKRGTKSLKFLNKKIIQGDRNEEEFLHSNVFFNRESRIFIREGGGITIVDGER